MAGEKIYVLVKKAPWTEPLNIFVMRCCVAKNIREAIKKFGAVIDITEKRPCYRNTHKKTAVLFRTCVPPKWFKRDKGETNEGFFTRWGIVNYGEWVVAYAPRMK